VERKKGIVTERNRWDRPPEQRRIEGVREWVVQVVGLAEESDVLEEVGELLLGTWQRSVVQPVRLNKLGGQYSRQMQLARRREIPSDTGTLNSGGSANAKVSRGTGRRSEVSCDSERVIRGPRQVLESVKSWNWRREHVVEGGAIPLRVRLLTGCI